MALAVRLITTGSSGSAPSEPGTQGTPARIMACLADTLSPMRRMESGEGPMKVKPLFSTRSAKSAFSDQEAVAGVDGFGIGHLGGRDDGRHVEVTVA